MNIWARHEGGPSFHAISAMEFKGSVVTRCNGRWSTSDVWEERTEPPHELKCDECQRRLVELRCVERGLDELEQSADNDDRSGLEHLFDVGGES